MRHRFDSLRWYKSVRRRPILLTATNCFDSSYTPVVTVGCVGYGLGRGLPSLIGMGRSTE